MAIKRSPFQAQGFGCAGSCGAGANTFSGSSLHLFSLGHYNPQGEQGTIKQHIFREYTTQFFEVLLEPFTFSSTISESTTDGQHSAVTSKLPKLESVENMQHKHSLSDTSYPRK